MCYRAVAVSKDHRQGEEARGGAEVATAGFWRSTRLCFCLITVCRVEG